MRIFGIFAVASCLLFISGPLPSGQSPSSQKIAEGQYYRFRDGTPVEGSVQTWVLTRNAEGKLLLHDEFETQPDANIQILAGLAAAGGSRHMSPELLDKLKEAVTLTG